MAIDPAQRAPRSLSSAGLRSALRFVKPEEASSEKLWIFSAKMVEIPAMKEGESPKPGIQFEIAMEKIDNPRVAITLSVSDERVNLAQQLKSGPIGPVWLIKIERKKGNQFWAFSDAIAPSHAISNEEDVGDGELPF